MKLVKIKVKRERIDSKTVSIYNPECRAVWLMNEGEIVNEGGVEYQYRIALMNNDLFTSISALYPGFYTEVTEQDAVDYCEQYMPTISIITNEQDLVTITNKIVNGETLTKDEIDSLNENIVDGVIRKKKSWAEKINESLNNIDIENKLNV